MKDVWEFVERYYPKYTSCPLIALEGDLTKIVEDPSSIEEGDSAHSLKTANEQEYEMTKREFREWLHDCRCTIYEKAIECFLKERKE